MKEDRVFIKRTEAAYKRYKKGMFKCMEFDAFIRLLKRL